MPSTQGGGGSGRGEPRVWDSGILDGSSASSQPKFHSHSTPRAEPRRDTDGSTSHIAHTHARRHALLHTTLPTSSSHHPILGAYNRSRIDVTFSSHQVSGEHAKRAKTIDSIAGGAAENTIQSQP